MMSSWLQPLIQSKARIAWNLFLAPWCGLSIPLLLFVLIDTSVNKLSGSLAFIGLIVFFAMCFYFIVIFPLLFIYFCTLQYFSRFNLWTIFLAILISISLFAVFIYNESIQNMLINTLIFAMPTAGMFLFLSLRSHRNNTQNLPI